jgi:hypothetical protein
MHVLTTVFSRISNIGIAVFVASMVVSASVWFPNVALIVNVFNSGTYSFIEKVNLLMSFYLSLQTNFSVIGATSVILIGILLGMNTALFVYYIRKMHTIGMKIGKAGTVSIGGFISGIFGIGCASCGAFIATTLLTSIGVGGIITLLPLGGEEFGIVGVALLVWSQYLLVKHIERGNICPI